MQVKKYKTIMSFRATRQRVTGIYNLNLTPNQHPHIRVDPALYKVLFSRQRFMTMAKYLLIWLKSILNLNLFSKM